MSDTENTRRLVLAIIDFLQSQLNTRSDFSIEDREGLDMAIECLIMSYDVENTDYIQSRPLMDMFMQVSEPVTIENRTQAESHKMSGNAKMEQEQYNGAADEYSRAIELDKWNAIYYCNRACARIKLEQYFEAISDCRQAVLLNPDYAKAYARMGQAYVSMNNPRRAAICFRQALDLEPDNERYQNNLRVAEGQVAQQPSMEMGNLIQSIVSSLILGGSPMSGGAGVAGPGASFMIIGDPHTEDQCQAHHASGETSDSSSDSNSTGENKTNDDKKDSNDKTGDNTTSQRRGEDEPVHLRVLVGIPTMMTDEDDTNTNSKSKNSQIIGQTGNITKDINKISAQKTGSRESKSETEINKESMIDNNGNKNTTQEGSSKASKNSNSDVKLGMEHAAKTNPTDNKPQIMGQHGNVTKEINKNSAEKRDCKEAKPETEVKRENINNIFGSRNTTEEKRTKTPKIPNSEDNLGKKDAAKTNTNDKSQNQGSKNDQEKSKNETDKRNSQTLGHNTQNSAFKRVDNSVKTNQSVKKDLSKPPNNPELIKANAKNISKGQGSPDRIFKGRSGNSETGAINQPGKEGIEKQNNNDNMNTTEVKGQPKPFQRSFTFKNPEGDTEKGQDISSIISMSDIANFFRNIGRSDRENNTENKNNSQLKQSSKEIAGINGQNKDNPPQGSSTPVPQNQPGQLPVPEEKDSKQTSQDTKPDNDVLSPDIERVFGSELIKKSKPDEEGKKKE